MEKLVRPIFLSPQLLSLGGCLQSRLKVGSQILLYLGLPGLLDSEVNLAVQLEPIPLKNIQNKSKA